jgi:hypothetical protein
MKDGLPDYHVWKSLNPDVEMPMTKYLKEKGYLKLIEDYRKLVDGIYPLSIDRSKNIPSNSLTLSSQLFRETSISDLGEDLYIFEDELNYTYVPIELQDIGDMVDEISPVDDLYNLQSGEDPDGYLLNALYFVLLYENEKYLSSIRSELKENLAFDNLAIINPLNSSDTEYVPVYRDQSNSDPYNYELIYDIDFEHVWLPSNGSYEKLPLNYYGIWNPNVFLSEEQMQSGNVQALIFSENKLPRPDFTQRNNFAETLRSAFYLHSFKVNEKVLLNLDTYSTGYADVLLSNALTQMSDLSIIDVASKYEIYKQESRLEELSHVNIQIRPNENQEMTWYNMSVSDYLGNWETALFQYYFESANPLRQQHATQILTKKVFAGEIKKVDPTYSLYNKQLLRGYGQIVMDVNTPLSLGLDDLYLENGNFYPVYTNPLNLIRNSKVPYTIAEIPSGLQEALLHSVVGRHHVDVVTSTNTQNNVLTLYRLFLRGYDELGLVSRNAGFLKTITNSFNLKFDKRFLTWGTRNDAGEIPKLTKMAFIYASDNVFWDMPGSISLEYTLARIGV